MLGVPSHSQNTIIKYQNCNEASPHTVRTASSSTESRCCAGCEYHKCNGVSPHTVRTPSSSTQSRCCAGCEYHNCNGVSPHTVRTPSSSTESRCWGGCAAKESFLHCRWDINRCSHCGRQGFPGGASGKEPPARARDGRDVVRSLGRAHPLEEGMAIFLP